MLYARSIEIVFSGRLPLKMGMPLEFINKHPPKRGSASKIHHDVSLLKLPINYFKLDQQVDSSTRWVSVVELHDGALSIGKVFGQESTVVKWNYQTLGLHQVTVRHKLGVILVIKWFKNWSQQKMLFTKKNFFRKIQMIFDIQNSPWKSKIGTFWQTVTRWRLKIW